MLNIVLPVILLISAQTEDIFKVKQKFAPLDIGDPEGLDVVLNKHDEVITVIGKFPMTAQDLVESQYPLFDKEGTFDRDSLRVLKTASFGEGGMTVEHYAQTVGGTKVWDSEVTVSYWADGDIHSINGWLFGDEVQQEIPRDIRDVAVALEGVTESATELDSFKTDKTAEDVRLTRDDGAWIERGYDRRARAYQWRFHLPESVFHVDESSLEVVRKVSHEDHGYDGVTTSNCTIRIPNYSRVLGFATGLDSQSGTQTDVVTCGGDDWFGTCYWYLKRRPGSFSHPIDQVDDYGGDELERTTSCTSNPAVSFINTGTFSMMQQTSFRTLHESRFYVNQNVWSNVAVDRSTLIYPETRTSSCGSWNDFSHALKTSGTSSCGDRTSVYMHEYGHYAVWTYDDVSQLCYAAEDEGNALDETLASCFGMIHAVEDPAINPRYGALSGFARGQGPIPHSDLAPAVPLQVNCDNNEVDFHVVGQPFEAAFWEILWNRNCSTSTCTETSGFGNQLWGAGVTKDVVIDQVGTALGASLKILGENITFSQVRAQILSRILADSGPTVKNNVQAIFTHHGI